MNFSFESDYDMQFGFDSSVPSSDSTAKLTAGVSELHLNGTNLHTAGKTILQEDAE